MGWDFIMTKLSYSVLQIRALMFFSMRVLDKIYEGEDIWGEEEPW